MKTLITVKRLERQVRELEEAIAEIKPRSEPVGRDAVNFAHWQKGERRRLEGLLKEARVRLVQARKLHQP